MISAELEAGIQNLLVNCAEIEAGERLLIIHEDPSCGWYDLEGPLAMAAAAEQLGSTTTLLQVGPPDGARSAAVDEQIAAHDRVIFMARMGDQDRFEETDQKNPSVMCYARDATALASAYSGIDHRAMLMLKDVINGFLHQAAKIHITCPLGTDVVGSPSVMAGENAVEVSVKRFPMGVPQPVLCDGFRGRVALARYLTPTGSKAYDPPNLAISGTVFAHIEGTAIVGWAGDAGQVAAIKAHYNDVASQFDIEPFVTHSWHAGIHPGCSYTARPDDDPDRWSNNIFTHPRVLHFHTCGSYAPGEICWSVLDPSVWVDDVALWQDGVLHPARFEEGRACLREWPQLEALFAMPPTPIGLGEHPAGNLRT